MNTVLTLNLVIYEELFYILLHYYWQEKLKLDWN